jgi:hypothetical protein
MLILTCVYEEEEYHATSAHKTELSALAQCLNDIQDFLNGSSFEDIYDEDPSQLKQLINDYDLWGFIKEWNSISGSCKFECEYVEIQSETEIPNIFD